MGLRLQMTYYSTENSIPYTISIYDEEYSGSVIDFLTDDNGAVISYDAQTQKMKSPVLTSKCEVNILIDSQDVEDFITDISSAYEGRFRLKVTSSSSGVWYGYILPDLVSIEDLPILHYPSFRLVATDGIKRLKKTPYKDVSGPYSGEESITQHLVNCIDFIGLTDLMTEEDGVLKSVTNWRPANRIPGDDMDHTYFDHRALYQNDKLGNKKYTSVYQVIEMLCYVFHCKFMMADGWYWFFQHNEYESDTISPDRYNANKTALVSSVVDSYISVDNTFTGKFGSGYYSFFPSLDIAQVNYIHFGYANLARGYFWDEAQTQSIPESPTVYSIQADTRIFFKATVQFDITFSGTRPAYVKFGLNFNVGSDYLKSEVRAATSGPSTTIYNRAQEITTTNTDNYEVGFLTPVTVAEPDYALFTPVEFTTIPWPNDGNFAFDLDYIGAYDADGAIINSGITITWSFKDVEVVPIPNGDTQEWKNTRSVTAYNATTGNSEREIINTIVGQEFGYGRLRIDTASGKDLGLDWGVGGTVANQSLEELLAIEVIRTQSVPIKRMKMFFTSSTYNVTKAIRRGSDTWVFHKGKFVTAKENFDGEWYLLDTSGTTSGNTVEDWVLTALDDGGNNITPIYPVGDGGGAPNITTEITIEQFISVALASLFPQTSADITEGATVTQIPIETRTVAGEWVTGQTINVIDWRTGAQQDFVVTADTGIGDTYISVTSETADFDLNLGSWIVTSQETQAVTGSSGAFYREEFPAHASATITVTENGGTLPSNAAAIRLYFDNGQIISKNYWSHSGSNITLTYTPNGVQSIWVEFNV